ncbi:MAG: hypothetical protein ACE5QV_09850, partial [Fidelibacterota bacterium]
MNLYHTSSKSITYSLLLTLPLLFSYEILAFFLNSSDVSGLRNTADVILKQFLGLVGIYGL